MREDAQAASPVRARAALERHAGWVAALAWIAFCVRWFDPAAPLRPAWLEAVPALPIAGLALAAAGFWATRLAGAGAPPPLAGERRALWLVLLLCVGFRLPLAVWGAAGYTTADAALSGIVALHAREGTAHHVFVPAVPYSGSLKSHLAAGLGLAIDLPQAFTLTSVAFYALFAAATFRLARQVAPGTAVALSAGLWMAFSPTFVTQYSLSNDGNYVEVLAFGTWALLLACRFVASPAARPSLALGIGLLLGLGFWCHILAIIHAAAILGIVALAERRQAAPSLLRIAAGFAIGDFPGLLWNARNGWASFAYLVPSGYWSAGREAGAGEPGPGLARRLALLVTDHGPVLFGKDSGYAGALDALVAALAWLGLLAALGAGLAAAASVLRERRLGPQAVLVLFAAANVAVALVALPHVPGNPRYVLFLFAPAAVWVAAAARAAAGRALLFVLVAFGLLGSLGQARHKLALAASWEALAERLEREGVRHCFSDFYIATPITFLTEERVTCSSKLGPTTTEYFFEYRERVDRAPEAAIVAVNAFSATRMERRLHELGVGYERLDLMKPVLLRLTRKVEPSELFPGRDFRMR